MNEKPEIKDKVGDRIGCVCSADEKTIQLFGYGVRLEDEVPIEAIGPMAEVAVLMKRKNPCILLDSGQKIYGCECWWAPEDIIKANAATREVIPVNIDSVREEWKKSQQSEGEATI